VQAPGRAVCAGSGRQCVRAAAWQGAGGGVQWCARCAGPSVQVVEPCQVQCVCVCEKCSARCVRGACGVQGQKCVAGVRAPVCVCVWCVGKVWWSHLLPS